MLSRPVDFDQKDLASFFACREGARHLYMTNGHHWIQLKKLMGRPQWLDEFDDDWLESAKYPQPPFPGGLTPDRGGPTTELGEIAEMTVAEQSTEGTTRKAVGWITPTSCCSRSTTTRWSTPRISRR